MGVALCSLLSLRAEAPYKMFMADRGVRYCAQEALLLVYFLCDISP